MTDTCSSQIVKRNPQGLDENTEPSYVGSWGHLMGSCIVPYAFLLRGLQKAHCGEWHVPDCILGFSYTISSMVQCKRGTFDEAGVSPCLLTNAVSTMQSVL